MKGEPVGVSQNQSNKDEEEERGPEELTNHAPLIRVNSIMVEYYYCIVFGWNFKYKAIRSQRLKKRKSKVILCLIRVQGKSYNSNFRVQNILKPH